MLDYISKPDISKCINNFSDCHHNTDTANSKTHLVCIEVCKLTDYICHKSKCQLP